MLHISLNFCCWMQHCQTPSMKYYWQQCQIWCCRKTKKHPRPMAKPSHLAWAALELWFMRMRCPTVVLGPGGRASGSFHEPFFGQGPKSGPWQWHWMIFFFLSCQMALLKRDGRDERWEKEMREMTSLKTDSHETCCNWINQLSEVCLLPKANSKQQQRKMMQCLKC